jgi:uncharacterized protein YdeI (YjbR/CyaY-like superfamily)
MVVPDKRRIRAFASERALETWLRAQHDKQPELWLKIHKKDSGRPSITASAALDVMLCWGWIDGLRKGYDEQSFLQRYSPRRARSTWSQMNCERIARLTAAGRMTAHGQKHVDAAKKDGRWDAAYAPIRAASTDSLPKDLLAAIGRNAKAKKALQTLNRMNLFALAFRVNRMKTATGRARKVASLVAMLARGETIVPQKAKRTARAENPAARG